MASCTDLNKLSTATLKATQVPILASRKFVEPFTRLKNRANLFRRKNYSSQTDISKPRSSLPADHFIPTDQLPAVEQYNIILKRSNSMICPQQRLQTFLKTTNPSQRNSVCDPTDDYRFLKSSSTRYWGKKMSNINENEIFPSDESLQEKKNEPVTPGKEQPLFTSVRHQSFEEPFYDCKPTNFDLSSSKVSTCTMTGKSLNNLDECLSTTSSEDKGVQTTFNESITTNCSTSLSSSSTSIQTDSLENKPKIEQTIVQDNKWIRDEQTCIYWVNYLGSTAIKISNDNNNSAMPINAINRLKQSTQYARVLPIIGLSISSRGVEFLKHAKERVVICFHDIKSIHCACQDQDLRYFAYVTHEHRLVNGTSTFTNEDYHNYCHVFVVKNQSMSTEILLNFGRAFDIAYRVHHRLNSKKMYLKKSMKMICSPGTSSSSSSIDEKRIFV